MFAAERVLPPLGGTERAFVEEAAAVAAAGHRVRTLGLGSPERVAVGSPAREIGWSPVTPPRRRRAFWDWRERVARSDMLGEAVRDRTAARRPDVVVTSGTAAPGVMLAAAAADVPLVLRLHGYETLCHWRFVLDSQCRPESGCRACPRTLALDPQQRAARVAHADGQREALARAAVLVAPSRLLADTTAATCGRRPIVVAPALTAPAAAAGDIDGPILAVSSLWTRDKGVDLLAPIAMSLRAGRRLIVQAGDGGREAPLPAALLRRADVEVRTTPAETADLLDGCSAVIVPSQLPEPWGRVAFEAMAAGIPVLASDTGGLREFVPASQRVAPHGDPQAWATALAALLAPGPWEAARAAGLAAAQSVLATQPARRFVEAVQAAAVRPPATAAP